MKREIKFRGKPYHTKSFSYGNFVFGSLRTRGELVPLINVYDENGYRDVRVDPETVGQFTGVTDGEGREIYEDDIVAIYQEEHCTFKGKVEYLCGDFIVYNKKGLITHLSQKPWQVIGNIHDNPELMEGGEK